MKKFLPLFALLTGCATQGIDRAEQNVIIQEFYASVQSVKPVELSSHVKTGILAGAGAGLLEESDGNGDDMLTGVLVGGLVGGLFTKISEGSNQAYQYTLYSEQQGVMTLIEKEQVDTSTGCVKVRNGRKVTISTAPQSFCSTSYNL